MRTEFGPLTFWSCTRIFGGSANTFTHVRLVRLRRKVDIMLKEIIICLKKDKDKIIKSRVMYES